MLGCGYGEAGGYIVVSGKLCLMGSYIMFPGGVPTDVDVDGCWGCVVGPCATGFWKSSVRLELGELVVPVSDHAKGGPVSGIGHVMYSAFIPIRRIALVCRVRFVLSYSSIV